MKKLHIILMIGLSLALYIQQVKAVGPCELFEHTITRILYSKENQQIAVEETYRFCIDEAPDFYVYIKKNKIQLEDNDGLITLQFVTIYNKNGIVLKRFLKTGNKRVIDAIIAVPPKYGTPIDACLKQKIENNKKMDAYLKQGRFIPQAPSMISLSGKYELILHQPYVGYAAVPYKWAIVNIEAISRNYLNGYHLMTSKRPYSGKLTIDAYWFHIKINKDKIEPLIVIVLKQKEGWAPGAPGALNTQEIFFINKETAHKYILDQMDKNDPDPMVFEFYLLR